MLSTAATIKVSVVTRVVSLTNSRGLRIAGLKSRSRSRVQSRGRGSNVAVAGPMSRQGKMILGSGSE